MNFEGDESPKFHRLRGVPRPPLEKNAWSKFKAWLMPRLEDTEGWVYTELRIREATARKIEADAKHTESLANKESAVARKEHALALQEESKALKYQLEVIEVFAKYEQQQEEAAGANNYKAGPGDLAARHKAKIIQLLARLESEFSGEIRRD